MTLALVGRAAAVARADAPILPLRLDEVCYEVGGVRLIDRITLEFGRDGKAVILGPNGAGKSLLLRLCHGLIRPSSGAVAWASADRAAVQRAQAMVFQRPVLLRRSVAANVDYALATRGTPRAVRARLVEEALEQAGLSALARRTATVLSGGEQQRLALARAWALRPQVLFLDEPTANLDPSATAAVEALIVAIQRGGAKIVMTTHDLAQARRLADEVVFLNGGRLEAHAAAAEFFAGPRSPAAAAFLEGRLHWN